MFLPPFPEFLGQIDMDKLLFDVARFGGKKLSEPTELFTKEQQELMMQILFAVISAVLMEYHNWLNVQISRNPEECP